MITRIYISPDREGLVIEFDNGDDGLFELEPGALELTEVDRVLDDDGWVPLSLPDDA